MNQIYNLRQAIRREVMDGSSSTKHCLYLATKYHYVAWTDINIDGQLTQLLIANLIAIQFIRTLPYLVLIDTTHKKNNKKLPFVSL